MLFTKGQISKTTSRGFTLIELLVVISIIGLLSSVLLVAVNSARIKARDAKRQTDLTQLQKAVEFYYQDNSQYPFQGGAGTFWDVLLGGNSWNGGLGIALKSYLASMPMPPPMANMNVPSWYFGNPKAHYFYIGGKNIKVRFSTSSKCVYLADGYYLFTAPEDQNLAQNDGGVMPDLYEKLGGTYTTNNATCMTNPTYDFSW